MIDDEKLIGEVVPLVACHLAPIRLFGTNVSDAAIRRLARRVGRIDLRLREATRLGFRRLLLPEGSAAGARAPAGAELVPLREVAEAVRWLRASRRP